MKYGLSSQKFARRKDTTCRSPVLVMVLVGFHLTFQHTDGNRPQSMACRGITGDDSNDGTYSDDFSYHLQFGKFSGMSATTGHTVKSVAVCMLKYRVETTDADDRHVVSFRCANF